MTDPKDDRTLIRPPSTPPASDATILVTHPRSTPALPDDFGTDTGGLGDFGTSAAPTGNAPSVDDLLPRAPAAPAASFHEDSSAALSVGTSLGEFEIESVLGEGGFGIVYLATDHSLGRQVALKEYMPSALAARQGGTEVQVRSERHRDTFEAGRKSFVNEARLLAQFEHPSLVKVYRFWEANGTAYMAMQYVQGTTLKRQLHDMGTPPDEDWLMRLLGPLTEALAVVHAQNCLHRDIAPDNVILLTGSGRPLLLDFGAARQVINDMTRALTVILKPGYAPVEQYAEVPSMRQGPWTDVYALAATVYFAIRGTPPPDSVGRMMDDSYVPLATSHAGAYSERFLSAIDRALALKPDSRTASVDAFRADLGLPPAGSVDPHRTVIEPRAAPASGREAPRSTTKGDTAKPGKSPALLIGGAVAAIAVAGVAAWLFLGKGSPQPAPEATSTAASTPARPEAGTPAPPPAATATGGATGTAPEAGTARPAGAPASGAAAGSSTSPATGAATSAAGTTPGAGNATGTASIPPPPPAGPFDPHAEIDRLVAVQTPDVSVQVNPASTRMKLNKDFLHIKVKSSIDGYVSVFALDPNNSLVRIFPNEASPKGQIKANQTLQVPDPAQIPLGEPAGNVQMLVLVSRSQRDYRNFQKEDLGAGYVHLVQPTGTLTGANGQSLPALLGAAVNCSGAGCDDFGAASFGIEGVK